MKNSNKKKGVTTLLMAIAALIVVGFALLIGKPTIFGADPGPANSFTCGTVNASLTLTSNVNSSGTCFVINASNIVLDCAGFGITGNYSGNGINATAIVNLTIKNCAISNFSTGILFDQTNNSFIANSSINHTSSFSISFNGAGNNSILNITAQDSFKGVIFDGNSSNNLIRDSYAFNLSQTGIEVRRGNGSTIIYNNCSKSGSFGCILLQVGATGFDSSGNRVENNTVNDSSIGISVRIGGSLRVMRNNLIRGNTVMNNSFGIDIELASGSAFTNTTFDQNLLINNNESIFLSRAFNITFTNTTLKNSPVWLDPDMTTPINVTFANTTFATNLGSIMFTQFNVSNITRITQSNLNITSNRAFLNSSNLTALNNSAIITLNGLPGSDSFPVVDFADSGSFAACPSNICTRISFSNGTLIFNVTRFTAYAGNAPPTQDNPILNSTLGTNIVTENLTVYPQNVSDANNDSVQNITDWRLNGTSMLLLNMPFETNVISNVIGAVQDYSTFGNNGTLGNGTAANSPVWNSSGQVGGAYTFDGINDGIFIPAIVPDPNQGSFEVWVKPAFIHPVAGIITYVGDTGACNGGNGFGGDTEIHLAVQARGDGNKFFFGIFGVNSTCDSTTALEAVSLSNYSAGNWFHVVAVYNANVSGNVSLKLYVNGQEDYQHANFIGSINLSALIQPTYIGRPNAAVRFFNGTIDELRIYNRTLTSEQIHQLYLDGTASHHAQTIVSNETAAGDNWTVAVTPNDHFADGQTKISNGILVQSVPVPVPVPPPSGGGGENIEVGSSSSAPVIAPCTPQWTCTGWNPCKPNGTQTRRCVSLDNCLNGMPNIIRKCEYVAPIQPVVPVPQPTEVVQRFELPTVVKQPTRTEPIYVWLAGAVLIALIIYTSLHKTLHKVRKT